MMKLKKLVSLMLVGSMVLGMTACGGDPANTDKGTSETPAASDSEGKVSDALTPSETGGSKALQPFEETVTIKMGHGLDPNTVFDEGETVENSRFVQWLKNDLNIDVQYDWICASSDFGQKINLCIASNTIPDAVNVGQSQYLAMLKYDQIQPLTDVFEEYASDQLKQYVRSGGDALMDAISYNGEMYAIPAPEITAGGVNIMWIRQDWLDQLVNIGGNRWGLDPIFGAYNSYPEYWLENDGKVTYGSVEPQTKEALAKLAEMYAAGAIDPEVFVRNDSLEPVTAGKAGIFFGPWWCGYTVDSVTLNGSQEWMAYMAPLAADGKFYSPMADPTKQYVCVRKGYEHPEAAIQIINYLIENEQSWVDNDMTQNNITASIYPLFNVYDNADEIEYSYEWLKKFNLGEVKKEDVDVTGRKLLRSDLDAIEVLKLDPKDDFSLEYWDLDHEMAASNIPRLVSIMIGERPLVEEGYVPIFNAYSGQTDTMAAKWANLQKLEEETFAKIILGQAPIDEFDNFVEKWYNEGGSEILEEITAAVNE